MSKIGQRLIVQIARDSAPLAFRFIRKVQTRIGKIAIGLNQRGTRGDDSPSFEYGPQEREERECQQNRQRRRRPGKRRALNRERKLQRLRGREILDRKSVV